MAAERREGQGEGQEVRIARAHRRMTEHELRLLPIGLVDELDPPALGRHRLAQLQRVRLRRGPGGEAVKRLLEPGGQRVSVDVAREGEHQVLAHEVTAEVRAHLVGARRLQGRRDPVGRMAVRMVGVEVAREEAPAQRAVVVAELVDLTDHLAARAIQLRRRERGAHDHVGDEAQVSVQVARQHLALEARRIGERRHVQRGAQPVERVVQLLPRFSARPAACPLGREVHQPLAVARVGGRAGARGDHHVYQRHRGVALDDQHRPRRPDAPEGRRRLGRREVRVGRRGAGRQRRRQQRADHDRASFLGRTTTTERAPVARYCPAMRFTSSAVTA